MEQDQEVNEHLACPICLEIPPAEVFQCRNGHTICKACSNKMANCPQCRVPFEANKIRNRALELILSGRPASSRNPTAKHNVFVHKDIVCDGCEMNPIKGTRHHCIQCKDYDLCDTCMALGTHSHHLFTEIKNDLKLKALEGMNNDSSCRYRNIATGMEPQEIEWIPKSQIGSMNFAVLAGFDSGTKQYVARARHLDGLIPGKLPDGESSVYFPYGCTEIAQEEYEVLVAPAGALSWVDCDGDDVPEYAVVGGNDPNGETYYIGRAVHNGALIVGKVHPSHRVCYVAHDGQEHNYYNFEILVHNAYGRLMNT